MSCLIPIKKQCTCSCFTIENGFITLNPLFFAWLVICHAPLLASAVFFSVCLFVCFFCFVVVVFCKILSKTPSVLTGLDQDGDRYDLKLKHVQVYRMYLHARKTGFLMASLYAASFNLKYNPSNNKN